ncbi:hypothetical protein O6H91_04G059800 [Diphasiastrum complanatum]|uniref:Uncharacterized protein n=1 Tax=Diphasiastrum complanatum TaxID=34168 RepID=A0ACC2DXE2_DIPCM|nr:hypothetical protein O6H91_04G059800 [Diphasiastrum complanatum]
MMIRKRAFIRDKTAKTSNLFCMKNHRMLSQIIETQVAVSPSNYLIWVFLDRHYLMPYKRNNKRKVKSFLNYSVIQKDLDLFIYTTETLMVGNSFDCTAFTSFNRLVFCRIYSILKSEGVMESFL